MNVSPNGRIVPLRQGICGACVVAWLVVVPLSGALAGYLIYQVFA